MLDFALYDLAGNLLSDLSDRDRGQVTVPLNDGRRGQVTIPLEHKAAGLVRPLSTVLRAWWYGRPVLAAPVTIPRFLPEQGQVEINATDPSFRLQRSYVGQRTDGGVFGYQGAVDQSEIMARLIAHVQPSAADGAPRVPVVRGSLPFTFARDRAYEPGKEIWGAIRELSEVQGGVDFELEPVAIGAGASYDDYYDWESGEFVTVFEPYPPGTLCKLNTYSRQGYDRSATVRFTSGFAWENCTVVYEPAGDGVITRSTKQGQSEEGQVPPSYLSRSPQAEALYGIYGSFEGLPDVSVSGTLAEYAQGQVSAAAFPVDFFDLIPAVEGRGYTRDGYGLIVPVADRSYGQAPRFGPGTGFDYWVGDTIAVHARHPDGIDGEFSGRVTDATISDVEDTGDQVVQVTVGPDIPAVSVT